MHFVKHTRISSLAIALAAFSMLGSSAVLQAQAVDNHAFLAQGNDAEAAKINAIPLDQLVMATCRQAWHLGDKNQDGFFDIVERLTELSAHNRGVTLPDDKSAGSRAGEWIRTQAIKDPDQLLYAVVDHAVVYSINKGTVTPGTGSTPK
jgi:hypothetical protein